MQWEAQFSEEEKTVGAAFEATLKDDPAALGQFMQEIDDTFNSSDTNGDGLLDRVEFKTFVERMDANGVQRGLKHRETDDTFIDMVYPCFDGFNQESQGVSKGEILMVLNLLNRKTEEECNVTV